ncbi:hypothetical protein OWV82_002943 [Melia azedarach]|uniref:Uncharacterized protein n=1 Tax=Melia azedarach TaxID=155640 RepID=A0ACC1Z4J5_MELAZ|nr:hypothetical protein OWV82_002943 [Melia azedarach]
MSRSHGINIAAILLGFLVLSTISYPSLTATEARILNFQAIQESLLHQKRLVYRILRETPTQTNTPRAASRDHNG